MRASKIYVEAAGRTQELLNVKWALRSAGYSIASTWHEVSGPSALEDHWDRRSLEELQVCDELVIISAPSRPVPPELAMMAGFALARGIAVSWIGARVVGLCDFPAVQQFDNPEQFQKQLIRRDHAQARLAA